jgi:hypothetical protein
MNLWTAFQQIVKTGGPLMIGEVVSIESAFGDQRCTVELLPSGATLANVIATGYALEIGQRWVIQDGRIVDTAPAGTVLTAEV